MRRALLALTLCATAVAHAAPTVVSADGRAVEIDATRPADATATLVFENGSRETLDTWAAVRGQLPAGVAVFTYNRPGYGHSADSPTPRDGHTIVEELRKLLLAQGFAPPYLLVGHSLGGLYLQLFAREHPDEVRGLLLVDSVLPGVIKRTEDFPFYARIGKRLLFSSAVGAEIDRIHDTGEEIFALPPRDGIPMAVLVNQPKSATAIPVTFGTVEEDPVALARTKALYPKARKVIVDSDHRIQTANPEFVVKEITGLLGLETPPH